MKITQHPDEASKLPVKDSIKQFSCKSGIYIIVLSLNNVKFIVLQINSFGQ